MRFLDRNKIPYEYQTYECDEFIDGISVADKIGLPHEQVYKTLVTVGKSGGHYVFVIPIAAELDLKKAAKAVGEKSVEMLHVKEITKVTGYVRGGCTAIGMKKQFPTVIDEHIQMVCHSILIRKCSKLNERQKDGKSQPVRENTMRSVLSMQPVYMRIRSTIW